MPASNQTNQKGWKGMGMEGAIARWYTRTRSKDMKDFRQEAKRVSLQLPGGSHVLEVAPGPGFFAIELAKLGDFKITGLDVSNTFVEIAAKNASDAGVDIDFRLGNASAMPFADESFDFIYCSAAFKNFSEPVQALDEMYRVLRAGKRAVIVDLCKDASIEQIDSYITQSGRSRIDAWITKWTFRHVLLKRAYSKNDFVQMAQQSRFGSCEFEDSLFGLSVQFTK
jgi:ubiquinone/menaquinone biosynthesis C-methylase UbiE